MVKTRNVNPLKKDKRCWSTAFIGARLGSSLNTRPIVNQQGGYLFRFWNLRFWYGMGLRAWFSLIWRNRLAISPRRFVMALIISILAFINGFLWLIQTVLLGKKIEKTEIRHAPVFVIGHWRSGTTLLHELLIQDPRHTCPDTYACFAPNHFLISAWFIKPMLKLFLPPRRPMDNMEVGWDRPQEDEFALCNMGLPSPYLTVACPERPQQHQEYLDFHGVSEAAKNHWKAGLLLFIKCLTLRQPKRVVVKSPLHTARIGILLELFPRAKFVHIARNPYVLFPSTVNLWRRLYWDQGLQIPDYKGLNDSILQTLTRMYEALDRDCNQIDPGQLCNISYENLIADPIGQIGRIYRELELGEFESVRLKIEAYFACHQDYKTNHYILTPELQTKISSCWSKYFNRYGYRIK